MSNHNVISELHRRTRRDHAMETAQDYVKAVQELQRELGKCRVVDLARWFGVSHVTVTRIVARLKRENLVTNVRYGPITLTELGGELAVQSQRQHQIVYDFLRMIGVSQEIAAIDAEGIEHHVSQQTLDCLGRLRLQLSRDPRPVRAKPDVA